MAEIDDIINEPSDSQKRIKSLSDKLVEKDQETATERAGREAAEKKAADAERKAAFLEGYADIVSTNPAAKEFKADIESKVMSGYSVEDATFAVLGKAGKLGQPASAQPSSPAGGSATTAVPQNNQKTATELSQAEKREILEKSIDWQ